MEFTLDKLLRVLKNFILIIITTTIASAMFFYLHTKLFIGVNFQTEFTLWSPSNYIDYNIAKTNSDIVLNNALEKINDEYSINLSDLKKMIQIEKTSNHEVFSIKITSSDSDMAYYIAKIFVKTISESTKEFKDVAVLNYPTGTTSYSDNLVKNTFIGGVIGFIFSTICAIIFSLIIKTVYNRKDIENNFNTNTISVIPKNFNEQALSLLSIYALNSVFNENNKIVAVTSCENQICNNFKLSRIIKKMININTDEAKTAQILAQSLANHKKTIYVNAKDNKESFNTKGEVGVEIATSIKNLSVVNFVNKDGVLLIKKMPKLLKSLSEKYDCVIVDVKSININSDALAIHNMIDGYILSVNAGNNNLTQIDNALNSLNRLNSNIYGIILANAKNSDVFHSKTFSRKR